MNQNNSGAIGWAETKAAKRAEARTITAEVWAGIQAEEQATDDWIVALRAARLARDAATKAEVPPKGSRRDRAL